MNKGVFIAIEGIDGSGKTKTIKTLSNFLNIKKIKHIITAEPTKDPIGKILREYLIKNEGKRDPTLEALLFATDRYFHFQNLILPALKNNQLVITDRYKYSSFVYQNQEEQNNGDITFNQWVKSINLFSPDADLNIFLDVNPEICLKRLKQSKRKQMSIMENKDTLFKNYKIYQNFVHQGKLIPIDGTQPPNIIVEQIFSLYQKYKK